LFPLNFFAGILSAVDQYKGYYSKSLLEKVYLTTPLFCFLVVLLLFNFSIVLFPCDFTVIFSFLCLLVAFILPNSLSLPYLAKITKLIGGDSFFCVVSFFKNLILALCLCFVD